MNNEQEPWQPIPLETFIEGLQQHHLPDYMIADQIRRLYGNEEAVKYLNLTEVLGESEDK